MDIYFKLEQTVTQINFKEDAEIPGMIGFDREW